MKNIGCFLIAIVVAVLSILLPFGIIYSINNLFFVNVEYSIKSYLVISLSVAALCFLMLFISDKIYKLKESVPAEPSVEPVTEPTITDTLCKCCGINERRSENALYCKKCANDL